MGNGFAEYAARRLMEMDTNSLVGTFKIRKGNENQGPMYVYVHGISSHSDEDHTYYVCHAPNSFECVWSEVGDLIDFTTWNDYEILLAEWRIDEAQRTMKRWAKELETLHGKRGERGTSKPLPKSQEGA
jgi:hypothetical protein